MGDNSEELLESIVKEQEELKLRLNNLQKLVSIVCSSVVKHKNVFPNQKDNLVKQLLDGSSKVKLK